VRPALGSAGHLDNPLVLRPVLDPCLVPCFPLVECFPSQPLPYQRRWLARSSVTVAQHGRRDTTPGGCSHKVLTISQCTEGAGTAITLAVDRRAPASTSATYYASHSGNSARDPKRCDTREEHVALPPSADYLASKAHGYSRSITNCGCPSSPAGYLASPFLYHPQSRSKLTAIVFNLTCYRQCPTPSPKYPQVAV
jgi:hypothetical protein